VLKEKHHFYSVYEFTPLACSQTGDGEKRKEGIKTVLMGEVATSCGGACAFPMGVLGQDVSGDETHTHWTECCGCGPWL
jgi:hypothetical protein